MWDEVQRVGTDAGLHRLGVCGVEPFREERETLVQRKAAGLSARLAFTYSRPDTATDIRASFAWAERLVVAGRSYLPEAGDPGPGLPGTGRIARFAVADAYVPLRAGLAAVADYLTAAGYRAEVLSDDSRLMDRAAAVRAGVGWWGKNSMVLAPGVGPWMLLGSVVTDAPLPRSQPMRRDCGSCQACLPACPTGALVAPGVLDARRCLAAWAQAPGSIPPEYREAMGDRLYGCDDCIDACPPGGRLREASKSRPGGRVDLAELLALSDAELLARFGHWYLPGRSPRVIRRNALVALGNVGTRRHLPLLAGYLGHPDPLLREHAEWAIRKVASKEEADALVEEVRSAVGVQSSELRVEP